MLLGAQAQSQWHRDHPRHLLSDPTHASSQGRVVTSQKQLQNMWAPPGQAGDQPPQFAEDRAVPGIEASQC